MSVTIVVPAGDLMNLKNNTLLLDHPCSCSRCNESPAEYHETHRLVLRGGFQSKSLLTKKYRLSKKYNLKIRVCETCYLSDYLTHPSSMDRDKTTQGRISRFHTIFRMIGTFFAVVSILLLTPLVPSLPSLTRIKNLWQIPMVVAIIILLLTWLSQRKQQNIVIQKLDATGKNYHASTRATTHTPILNDEKDMTETALQLNIQNEDWAAECASLHHWVIKNDVNKELFIDDREYNRK